MENGNNFILTGDMVKLLKCSLCDCYLSVSPVVIISEDGTKYKCGRCHSIKTYVNTWAVMYENLAKFMKFPCIFKDCVEKLPWAKVKEHEKSCEHRSVVCPRVNCEETIKLNDFASHFKEKHAKVFHSNSLTVSNIPNIYSFEVLEKDGKTYVVLFDYDETRFGVTVCAFEHQNYQYEIVLSLADSKISITINEQNIISFDERVHCFKCIRGVCKSEFHVFKYYRKGIMKRSTTKIEKDVIKRAFGKDNVSCTLNIVEEKTETEDDLDDILIEKDMIIDEVNDEEDVPASKEDGIFQQLLQCPSCKESMVPPIYQCMGGHTLCNSCKSKTENCSTCQATIENTRNYILEEVAANLKLSDQQEAIEDDNDAASKEITCPLAKCFDNIKIDAISSHFKEHHIDNFHFNNFSIKNVYAYYNIDVLVRNNKTYIILFDFDDISFGISVCSLEPDQSLYEVKLTTANGTYSISASDQKIILFNDKEHCFKCTTGRCKNNDHTYKSKQQEIFNRLTTKINRYSVRRMCSSGSVNYNITITDSKNTTEKDKILRQMYECPICKDYMVPPIFQCIAGHTLCNTCKSKLEKCPSCESKIEDTRNYVLEDMVDGIELPCQYEQESCRFRAGVKRIAEHELECPMKSKKTCVEEQ